MALGPWGRWSFNELDRPEWDDVEARVFVAYFKIVAAIGGSERRGILPLGRALERANLEDLQELADRGVIELAGDTVKDLGDHYPSEAQIRASKRAAERMRAYREERRAHGEGDHSLCRSHRCKQAVSDGSQERSRERSRERSEVTKRNETKGPSRADSESEVKGRPPGATATPEGSASASSASRDQDLRHHLEQRPERFTEEEITRALKAVRKAVSRRHVKNVPRLAAIEANRARHGRGFASSAAYRRKKSSRTSTAYTIAGTPVPRARS